MYKYLLTLLAPLFLHASLTYQSNYTKEVALLEALDIEPSFLHDPIMNDMRQKISSINKSIFFFRTMDSANIFVPAIKSTLAQYDMPQEFLYLAMAESNFRTHAYSNKRAAGLWQFMPETGKIFHLKIDEYVDERRDFIKSTKAAARYLSSLHRRFGKWYLAAIAYNCGGGRLNQGIREAGSNELSVLLDEEKKYIPKESRYYIRKIVALMLVGSDEQYLLSSEYEHLLNRANAFPISTVQLSSGESLKRVAKLIDMPLEELQKINRHLKYDFVPPYAKNYDVYIPYNKLADFKRHYFEAPMKNMYKVHIVTSGDNLSYIGQKYGVSYAIIKDFNHLESDNLKLKQKLIIPIPKYSVKKKLDTKHYYMVKSGDSLDSISHTFKVSVKNIKTQNHLKGSLIKIGERLRIYE